MLKKYIGRSRAENLDWLVNVWLKDGPPVCFLQGFSGVGKTDLARDVRELAEKQQTPDKKPKWQQAVMNEVADRPTPSVIESLMELSVTLSRQGLPEMEQILFEQKEPNLAYSLEKALERPVLIILDEAERFFRNDTGAPLPEMESILNHLRYRLNLPGRLLLLSDRVVEELRWSAWIPKRTLTKLEPDEAVEALDTKLGETGLTVDIPLERKKEVVRDLDFNPRAIEALVAALRYESLDEIIGSNPGLWAVEDREVSRDFLKALEKDLLERTLRHLSDVHQRRLWRLAVHRRSFKREAVEKLCGTSDEADELRSVLVTRYLLNFYKGALSLNPIVREISLGHLREESAEFKQAHSGAADYHLRHFKAKQMVGSHTQLGESFAELRYHLVMAGRKNELGVIGHRFTAHLKRKIGASTSVPSNADELDERIGVLSVLVEDEGARGLEEHLARCLQARNEAGDLQKAVFHAERATGPHSSAASWYLLAKLHYETSSVDVSITTIRNALCVLADPSVTQPLYRLGAEILSGANKQNEALELLKEGIRVIPAENNLFSLYQTGADLLAKVGRLDEALSLLKDGIKVIPPDKSLFSLYRIGADLLAKMGKPEEALSLLKEGIDVIPAANNLFALYQISAALLAKAGKTDEAANLLKEGIKVIPPDKSLFSLYQLLSEVHCRAGRVEWAIASLREGFQRISADFGGFKLVEGALFLCAASDAKQTLADILSGTGADAMTPQLAALGNGLQHQMLGDWQAAANTFSTARQHFSRNLGLASLEAFSRLADGEADAALQALPHFPHLTFDVGEPIGWLATFIHLRRGDRPQASVTLTKYLGRPIDEVRELNEACLLRLWDQQEIAPESSRLCFHFPVMPASLTGLSQEVRRVPFGKQVLPVPVATSAKGVVAVPQAVSSAEPDVYVSYAWGDDSSPEGANREEVVNKMCEAVGLTGRVVGRDKTVMQPGDSIDAFADKIAKAPRMVAVISAKSLHSKFCMVDEIYSAYQRCGFRRAEFQAKVITLVMDDATTLLNDAIGLVKHWKAVHEQERDDLKAVDPNNKALERWGKVHKLGDMCDHLLDMLDALKDIIMPQGYENIVRGNFDEVIGRLPPK